MSMFVQNRFLRLAACGRLTLLAGVALLFLARPGMATHVPGTPNNYNVTVNEFSLCADSNCTSKTTIIGSASAFDLAGATPGASAGDYVPAGTSIPSGTYSHFLIKIGRSIGVVGRITNIFSGQDCITDTTTANQSGGAQADAQPLQSAGAGTPGTTTFTIPVISGTFGPALVSTSGGSLILTIQFAEPITVNDGEAMPSFGINFDITDAFSGIYMGDGTCDMLLGSPGITVKVGGQTLATVTITVPSPD